MPRLQLKVLGGFEARIGPAGKLDIVTRKTRALLAYLALPPGRPHTRNKHYRFSTNSASLLRA